MKKFLIGMTALALLARAAEAKLNIIATTEDFGSIAKEIGGGKVDVFTLAKSTEDPHFVDAKPSFIVKLNRADAVIEGGAELEVGWLPPLLEGARNPKLDSGKPGHISCMEGLSLLEIPTALDRSKGDLHAAGNPHYMTDPANAKVVAEHIANAFAQLDPKSADVFKANLKTFTARLDAKMQEWQKALAPFKGKRIVAYHNAWPYFGKRFDLPIDLFLEPKPGIPPSASHLAEVVTTMKAETVKVIIVEPFHDRHYAETVTKHTDAAIVDVSSYPGAKGAGNTYVDWMDNLVKSLVKGFESKK